MVGGQQFVRSVFGRVSPTSCGYVVNGDNFIRIHDFHLFKWIHGLGYSASTPVREANSHPGKNARHGTNASKRPNKAEQVYPQNILYVKLGYESQDMLRSFLFEAPALQYLAKRGLTRRSPPCISSLHWDKKILLESKTWSILSIF